MAVCPDCRQQFGTVAGLQVHRALHCKFLKRSTPAPTVKQGSKSTVLLERLMKSSTDLGKYLKFYGADAETIVNAIGSKISPVVAFTVRYAC